MNSTELGLASQSECDAEAGFKPEELIQPSQCYEKLLLLDQPHLFRGRQAKTISSSGGTGWAQLRAHPPEEHRQAMSDVVEQLRKQRRQELLAATSPRRSNVVMSNYAHVTAWSPQVDHSAVSVAHRDATEQTGPLELELEPEPMQGHKQGGQEEFTSSLVLNQSCFSPTMPTPTHDARDHAQTTSRTMELGENAHFNDDSDFENASAAAATPGGSQRIVAMSPSLGELSSFLEKQEERLESRTAQLESKMEQVIAQSQEEREKVTNVLIDLLKQSQEEKRQLREEARQEKAALEEKMEAQMAAAKSEMEAK